MSTIEKTKLNPFQVAAANAYGGGDFSHVTEMENPEDYWDESGDTLFGFIMRELADDGGPMHAETARERMESAIRDIQTILNALPEEPSQHIFYRCGICECLHPIKWNGDCRQDDARFVTDELDEKFGPRGWEEVEMPKGQQIEKHVLKITDQTLKQLEKQCDNDPYTGIAALAAALCSLARASGTPRSEIDKLLTIIFEDMAETI